MTDKQEKAFEKMIERAANRKLVSALDQQFSSDDEEEDASSILWSEDFFSILSADIAKAGLVGEQQNALATYVIGTSRLRKSPLNLIVKGASGAGKNHLVRTVFKFFPEGEVVAASSLSAQAIQYAGKTALKHKIFYLDELRSMTHPARQLISEGRIIRKVTEVKGGQRVTVEYVTEGPVSCITTTTENALQIDDESRNFSIWIDEGDKQTKAISKALVASKREQLSPTRLGIWHEVQHRIAKIKDVEVVTQPWLEDVAEKILPYGDLRIRRYWPAFVEACKVVCLIRSAKYSGNSIVEEGLTVSFDDFAITVSIFDRIIAESLTNAGRDEDLATAQLVGDLFREMAEGSLGVSADDLVGQPGIRTLDRAYLLLRRAERAGTIIQANIPKKNNEKLYQRRDPARFLGAPANIVTNIGLKISGYYLQPITGKRIHYGRG